jgi:hypothetical protein
MKYIILDVSGIETPFIFPESIGHNEAKPTNLCGCEIVSAGFCNHSGNVWGESITLKKKYRPEDSQIIKQLFNISAE